jgi:hypothetical protein
MPNDDQKLRAELWEARAKVRHQIEIASSPSGIIPVGGASVDNRAVIAELEAELSQLEDALAGLGGGTTRE